MNQPGSPITGPKENLKAIQLICMALAMGIVIFSALIIIICLTKGPVFTEKEKQYNDYFLYAAATMAILCFLWARSAYRKKITGIKNSSHSLMEKLNLYRSALILYMAPCEAAALFSIVVLFMTGNFLLLIITGAMLLAMLINFPWRKRVTRELNLDWKDQAELN